MISSRENVFEKSKIFVLDSFYISTKSQEIIHKENYRAFKNPKLVYISRQFSY